MLGTMYFQKYFIGFPEGDVRKTPGGGGGILRRTEILGTEELRPYLRG
jgi:hypothetical protein